MTVNHLHHYNIQAPQNKIDEVKTFYAEILGLVDGYRPNFSFGGNWLYIGDDPILHLSVSDQAKDPDQNGYLHHIALRCSGLVSLVEKLKEKEIKYFVNKIEELNQVQIFIKDPANTRLELNFENESLD